MARCRKGLRVRSGEFGGCERHSIVLTLTGHGFLTTHPVFGAAGAGATAAGSGHGWRDTGGSTCRRPKAAPESTTAEQSGSPAEEPPDEQAPDLPVSLSRIRRGLSHPPAIKLNGDRVVFRVEVLGKKPTIEDILGPDYLKGPVPNEPAMTHQEFLDMVTPKDVQGYAAFSNREGADGRRDIVCTAVGAAEGDSQVSRSEAGTRARSRAQGSAGCARRPRKSARAQGRSPAQIITAS